jgi:hypothetical protein
VADFNRSFGLNNAAAINQTAARYTIGGGVDYKVNPAWSVKAVSIH